MRRWSIFVTAILLCLIGTQQAFAQTQPLAPGAIDPAVSGALSQYASSAAYPYAGDCQTAQSLPGAVCTLVFAEADGSQIAGFYLLGDDGAAAPESFDALRFPSPAPPPIPPARLLIPRIGVNAPVVTLGVIAATNTLDAPRTKDDVGYYNFTPVPDYGGNTVLAGHVDWYTGEAGVFWNLRQLLRGDLIQLVMPDGTVFTYQMTDMQLYDSDTAPIDAIIGDTTAEALTLITCDGIFDPAAAEYNQRRVVRAVRLYG